MWGHAGNGKSLMGGKREMPPGTERGSLKSLREAINGDTEIKESELDNPTQTGWWDELSLSPKLHTYCLKFLVVL